ncbi:MAG: hypothetical protein ACXVRW_18920 [Solirubrobacteraceae bacterium]
MEAPTLQWSAADVRNGTLTVEIAGDRPKGWKATFQQTVRVLGGGEWGEVSLKGATVRVADVPEGSEDKLRHFLDAVVQQANATHVEPDDDDDQDGGPDDASEGEGDDADARMTSRFRDFGPA